jgi:hypothetical protein
VKRVVEVTKEIAIASRNKRRAQHLVRRLQHRQFGAYYCDTMVEAKALALSFVAEGSTVSFGGSMTLQRSGIIEQLHRENVVVLDREQTTTPAERLAVMRQALLADTYFTSINGISADGQLVNLDNVGNRVAAITFGPTQVVALVSMKKVAADLASTIQKVRHETAPINATRLGLTTTPCSKTGNCGDCQVAETICSSLLITRFCKVPERIKIILINEDWGI